MHNVVCIGFGPAALSLAVGLHEQETLPKALFIESSTEFQWRAKAFPLDHAPMRTNFMQDLVTERNPLSKYTLVNYLWSTGMLVMYTNLSAINPPREVFDKYLNWCAQQIEELGWVKYGAIVKSIQPSSMDSEPIHAWRVIFENGKGETECVLTRKVVIASGSQSTLPEWASQHDFRGKLVHSSEFGKSLLDLQVSTNRSINVAVVGANNEALEIFGICQRLPHVSTTLVMDEGLQERLGSKIENKISGLSVKSSELQQAALSNTQCSLPRTCIEKEYLYRYSQCVREAKGGHMPSKMIQATTILSASKLADQIVLEQFNNELQKLESSAPFDYVFVAAGRRRLEHKRLLKQIGHLIDSIDDKLMVDNKYKVLFRSGITSVKSGIWVVDGCNDCNEDAFATMAARTQSVLESMAEEAQERSSSYKPIVKKLLLENARL